MDSIYTNPVLLWLFLLTIGVAVGLLIIVLVAAKIVAAIRTIRGEVEQRSISPQPLLVQESEPFATKRELGIVRQAVEVVDHDLKTLRREITVNGEERRRSIEARVENARSESQIHTENVRKELSQKIDDLPNSIITTLKNTGAI